MDCYRTYQRGMQMNGEVECGICMGDWTEGHPIYTTTCTPVGHTFCLQCISEWAYGEGNRPGLFVPEDEDALCDTWFCPMCKTDLPLTQMHVKVESDEARTARLELARQRRVQRALQLQPAPPPQDLRDTPPSSVGSPSRSRLTNSAAARNRQPGHLPPPAPTPRLTTRDVVRNMSLSEISELQSTWLRAIPELKPKLRPHRLAELTDRFDLDLEPVTSHVVDPYPGIDSKDLIHIKGNIYGHGRALAVKHIYFIVGDETPIRMIARKWTTIFNNGQLVGGNANVPSVVFKDGSVLANDRTIAQVGLRDGDEVELHMPLN